MAHDISQMFGPKDGYYYIALVKSVGYDVSYHVYYYSSAARGMPDWDSIKRALKEVYDGDIEGWAPADYHTYTGQQLIAYYDGTDYHKN